jgi:translation initiation factor IF-3
MKNDNLKGQHTEINEQIRAKEVRVVGEGIESKYILLSGS